MALDACGFNVATKEEVRKRAVERERGLRTDVEPPLELDASAPSHPKAEGSHDFTVGFPTLVAKEALRVLALLREKGQSGSWF